MTSRKQPIFIGFGVVLAALHAAAQDPGSQSTSGGDQQAEYAGPSILSRGSGSIFRAPTQPIKFTPFFSVGATYDNGLTAVSIRSDGSIPRTNTVGMFAAFGVSGYQRFKRSTLSADFNGGYSHYANNSYFNGGQSNFGLSYSNNLTRRLTFGLNGSAAIMNRGFSGFGYDGFGALNPDLDGTPRTELFDGQTWFVSTMGRLTYKKSARMSFHVGGGYGTVVRRSAALFGAQTLSGQSSMAYRVSRNTTSGVQYSFNHFAFSGGYGGSDVHTVSLIQALRLGRRWELSGFFGMSFIDNVGLRRVEIDPVIAAILGQTAAIEAYQNKTKTPAISLQITRAFRRSSLHGTVYQGVSSGNGIVLTSRYQSATIGYGYSGFKKWSFGVNANYHTYSSLGPSLGKMNSWNAGCGMGRQIVRNVSWHVSADTLRYAINSSTNFNRNSHRVSTGISFSPGEYPLRIW